LEIIPELTHRFEVLLVDDGSTDASRDTANELSLGFPQVQVVAQSRRLGPQECLRSALRFTHGEFAAYCTDRPEFDLHELRKLWDGKSTGGAVVGRCAVRGTLGSIPQPPASVTSGIASLPELLMVPRRLLAAWHSPSAGHDVLAFLRDRGYGVQSVALRRRSFGGSVRPHATSAIRTLAEAARFGTRLGVRPEIDRVVPPMPRPNLHVTKKRATAPNG
jgi:glycosyltransferase involved in cell wall biosynthesis